jgi:hypothetical protein
VKPIHIDASPDNEYIRAVAATAARNAGHRNATSIIIDEYLPSVTEVLLSDPPHGISSTGIRASLGATARWWWTYSYVPAECVVSVNPLLVAEEIRRRRECRNAAQRERRNAARQVSIQEGGAS